MIVLCYAGSQRDSLAPVTPAHEKLAAQQQAAAQLDTLQAAPTGQPLNPHLKGARAWEPFADAGVLQTFEVREASFLSQTSPHLLPVSKIEFETQHGNEVLKAREAANFGVP